MIILIVIVITYILMGLAYLTGYYLISNDGGFLSCPHSFVGLGLSGMLFPFVIIGSIIYLAKKIKPNAKYAIIEYLILTLFPLLVVFFTYRF